MRLAETAAPAAPPYDLVDIGYLGFVPNAGPQGSLTFGMNSKGQVAFSYLNASGQHVAAVYLPTDAYGLGAGVHNLHTLFGGALPMPGFAHDINDAGQIALQAGGIGFGVGSAVVADLANHQSAAGLTAMPSGGGASWGRAVAIANGSPVQVVYESTQSDLCRLDCGFGEPLHSFVGSFLATLDPGGTIVTPLEPSGCNPSSFAVDVARVDESTLAVGMADQIGLDWFCFEGTPQACDNARDALLWSNPALPVILPPLTSGVPAQYCGAAARGLNAQGDVAGWGAEPNAVEDCPYHALLWKAGEQGYVDLHSYVPTGVLSSRAEAISSSPLVEIVGWDTAIARPLLWRESGASWSCVILDPADESLFNEPVCPGVSLFEAWDVNKWGWIIAWGSKVNPLSELAETHLFLLVPAPVCAGDADRNGFVNFADLLLILSTWGPCESESCEIPCLGDLDGLNGVDFQDLLIVLNGWTDSEGCLGTVVGPPTTVAECIEKFGFDPIVLAACIEASMNN